jgi:hypothetical protein
MTIEMIITTILAAAPSLLATIAVAIFTAINKKFTKEKVEEAVESVEMARAAITSSKEYTELKDQLVLVHKENVALKKTVNELLTKIDRVSRPTEEE